jgi:hypothetical protein
MSGKVSEAPLRPNPESIQRARELYFDPPLDEGIREIVMILASNGKKPLNRVKGDLDIASPSQQSVLRDRRVKD